MLASHYTCVRYHKMSQTALEFHFIHSPVTNNRQIQGAPPASVRHWWIVCSFFHWPWWDGRWSGWHQQHVWLVFMDRVIWLFFGLPAFMFESLAFFFHFLNVVRHKIQCWKSWQLVWFRSENEQWSMHHIRCWSKLIAHVHLQSLS
jgi:hypothetical protein